MGRSTQERHQGILSELLEKKHVTVSGLAANMEVSEATVRRDLKALAESRQLTLVHGGATLPRTLDYSFQAKHQRNVGPKQVVGRLAAALVQNGDQIFLDSGTTAFAMTPHLKQKKGLCVVANSARLAFELDVPGMNVIMLGGKYRPDRMDTVGPIAISTLEQLRGYKAFVGTDGLSMDFGPAASDIESAHLHRLCVQNAQETILLADSSKFAGASLFRIVEWTEIDRLVTDARPNEEWVKFLDRHGIELIHPSEEPVADAVMKEGVVGGSK